MSRAVDNFSPVDGCRRPPRSRVTMVVLPRTSQVRPGR